MDKGKVACSRPLQPTRKKKKKSKSIGYQKNFPHYQTKGTEESGLSVFLSNGAAHVGETRGLWKNIGFSGMPVDRNAFFQILRKCFNIIPLLPFATVILRSRFRRKKQKSGKCQGRTLTRVWLYGREVVAVSACRLCLSLCEALSLEKWWVCVYCVTRSWQQVFLWISIHHILKRLC